MSIKATNWAWETDLPQHLKIVLLALAHCHNGKNSQCNPRVKVIALMVGRSERSIKEALKELKDLGYIASARRRAGKRQASNHYLLALDGVVFQSAAPRTLRKSKKHVESHPETTTARTLYREQELEHEVTSNADVIAFPKVGTC